MTINSFPPVIGTKPETLILGTMPGEASLQAKEYYAHPRNQFWPIMNRIFTLPSDSYKNRITSLQQHPIALWDVLDSCTRKGSLDSNITEEHPNAIAELLDEHNSIQNIAFNGKPAAKLFKKHIKLPRDINLITLPSTSPAYAGMSAEEKLKIWEQALTPR